MRLQKYIYIHIYINPCVIDYSLYILEDNSVRSGVPGIFEIPSTWSNGGCFFCSAEQLVPRNKKNKLGVTLTLSTGYSEFMTKYSDIF
jgi:hypothetical protein